MKETVRLWSKDYSEVLFTTEDREAAKTFFLESGHDWLPIVIEYGTDWVQRWSGRIERDGHGTAIHQDSHYLKYLMQWPSMTTTDTGHVPPVLAKVRERKGLGL